MGAFCVIWRFSVFQQIGGIIGSAFSESGDQYAECRYKFAAKRA